MKSARRSLSTLHNPNVGATLGAACATSEALKEQERVDPSAPGPIHASQAVCQNIRVSVETPESKPKEEPIPSKKLAEIQALCAQLSTSDLKKFVKWLGDYYYGPVYER